MERKIESSAQMRQFLVEQMIKTAEGNMDIPQGKMICNFAQQIYNTAKLELNYAALKAKAEITSIAPLDWSGQSRETQSLPSVSST